jgi:hypothetical protein
LPAAGVIDAAGVFADGDFVGLAGVPEVVKASDGTRVSAAYVNVLDASLLVSLLCYMSLLLSVALLSLTFSSDNCWRSAFSLVHDVTVIEIAAVADVPNLKVFYYTSA